MKDRAFKNREALKKIQYRYANGIIDRQQAKIEAQPVLEQINSDIVRMTEKLNRKYKIYRKPPFLSFVAAMRNEYL